jgi:hypothetical protein
MRLVDLLKNDTDNSVWNGQVSSIIDNIRLERLEIVDGEVVAVHINSRVGGDRPLKIERDADYGSEEEDEEQQYLSFLQELFFCIDNFEHDFSVSMPMINGGYSFSTMSEDGNYLCHRYMDYSYAEARELFIYWIGSSK